MSAPVCQFATGCSHPPSCTSNGRCLDVPNPYPLEGAELDAAIERYLKESK